MGSAGTAKEPPVKPAAFHWLFQLLPRTGLSVLMQVVANARPLLSAVRRAAVLAVLLDLASFHAAFKPGTAAGLPPCPAGWPVSAMRSARMAASVFCFSPTATPWAAAPSAV